MRSGFSLVELSIVLVILGLLVGGVLSGQSLIHSAQLRKIVTQEQNYAAATRVFRDKYFALPGDMPNASLFWGHADNSTLNYCAPQTLGTSSTTGTCNGNGDGFINFGNTSSLYNGSLEENSFYWQHLQLAGLIQEAVTVSDPYGGFGGPKSPIGNGAFRVGTTGYIEGLCGLGAATVIYGQKVWGFELINNGYCPNPNTVGALKAEDIWNIDTKIDDGKPAFGSVMTMDLGFFDFGNGSPQHCTDAAITGLPTMYRVADTTITCDVLFVMGPGS